MQPSSRNYYCYRQSWGLYWNTPASTDIPYILLPFASIWNHLGKLVSWWLKNEEIRSKGLYVVIIIWLAFLADIYRALWLANTRASFHHTRPWYQKKNKQKAIYSNKLSINLPRAVLTGKSQTSALTYWPRYRSVNVARSQSAIFTFSKTCMCVG